MIYFWLLFSKVNVVSFNTEASTDGGSDVTSCFSERLALAVPENKRSLKKYINGPKFIAQRKSNSYEFFFTIMFHFGKLPTSAYLFSQSETICNLHLVKFKVGID